MKCHECGCETIGGYAWLANGIRLPYCKDCGLIRNSEFYVDEAIPSYLVKILKRENWWGK